MYYWEGYFPRVVWFFVCVFLIFIFNVFKKQLGVHYPGVTNH